MHKIFMIKVLLLYLFLNNISSSQTYWARHGWQVYENAGDARTLSIGAAAVTDYGSTTSSLKNFFKYSYPISSCFPSNFFLTKSLGSSKIKCP